MDNSLHNDLRKIARSPFKRFLVMLVINICIYGGPNLDSFVMEWESASQAWRRANDLSVTASLRAADFFQGMNAPRRYRSMYFTAMVVTCKHMLKQYGVAIWQDLKVCRHIPGMAVSVLFKIQ